MKFTATAAVVVVLPLFFATAMMEDEPATSITGAGARPLGTSCVFENPQDLKVAVSEHCHCVRSLRDPAEIAECHKAAEDRCGCVKHHRPTMCETTRISTCAHLIFHWCVFHAEDLLVIGMFPSSLNSVISFVVPAPSMKTLAAGMCRVESHLQVREHSLGFRFNMDTAIFLH
jgi:hypothetical protein